MTQHNVKILEDVVGHNDVNGAVASVATKYKAGVNYKIGEGLLNTFISMGIVELIDDSTPQPIVKNPADEREKKVITPKEPKKPTNKKAE